MAQNNGIPLVSLRAMSAGYAGRVVLEGINLVLHEGDRVAILGRSGSGKSTLLNLLYDELNGRAALIPQAASLVPQLSAFHNVYMGRLDRAGSLRNLRMLFWPDRKTLGEVAAVLAQVDMAEALRQPAGSLSGGQAQRTSVARALYNGRAIVIGDEPVSALDRAQGGRVLETLAKTHATSVLALHDVSLALEHCSRIIMLRDGAIALDAPSASLRESDLAPLYR